MKGTGEGLNKRVEKEKWSGRGGEKRRKKWQKTKRKERSYGIKSNRKKDESENTAVWLLTERCLYSDFDGKETKEVPEMGIHKHTVCGAE